MTHPFRQVAALAVVSALSLAAGAAQAAYPERPITLIVPWGAGGGTDATGRMIGSLLEAELGQPVNVVNRTGGSGVVGHSAIATAEPDGYTIGVLTVEIGMMHWSGLTDLTGADYTPIALYNYDPAGLQVRGTARRPETTVISTPAMETSEALSWLVFGRPLSTTTSNESEQLSATALALGAGGNLVAQQLGAQLGLDEAGVTDSRNLGGATFTIGKYVSPRLFLSYGVSLIGSGQVVTLKYLLTRGFDISIEQGNESAASLNWRRER